MINLKADRAGNVHLLALCPLLAVSDTVVNAIGLGVALLIIVPISFAAAAALRALAARWLSEEGTLAANVLVTAAVIAAMELLMRARFHDLRESLGIFLPLVLANLAILHELQTRAAKGIAAIVAAVKLSTYIALTLLVLGIARELVGRGSLLHGAGRMLGAWAGALETNVFSVDMGFLLAMLPPGAFIALGLVIALRNWAVRDRAASRTT